MASILGTDKQITVIAALADTIMRLGVKIGQSCTALLDETMRDPVHPKRHLTVLHIPPVVSP